MASGTRAQRVHCLDSAVSAQAVLSQEVKDEKVQLFMKYFDAKANEKIREMEQTFGKLMDMVGSVLAVHLLKMPAAIKRIKLKDFLVTGGTDQVPVAAVMADLPDEGVIATLANKAKKKGKAPLTLNSTESKSRAKSTTAKSRTVPKVPQTKPSLFSNHDKEMHIRSGPKPGNEKTSVHQGALMKKSLSDKRIGPKASKCSYPKRVNRSLPIIKIPLADGQAISAAGEEVNNIDVQSLDPQALQGIQLLVTQLTALCEKAQNSAKHANSI
ncbi:borealin-2-like isoform X2 [Pristis pectinata]|uniref:borealin-2-like isoform X2 n=1 Tax=Pristis pectinata TaxID=685728 RepID=UPI00223DB3CF|nr:borealin-2-like isoform X2 [Pristis pectinata]